MNQRIIFIAVLLLLIVLAAANQEHVNFESIRQTIEQAGIYAPLIFMLAYAMGTVLFLPGLAMTLLGGALFGPYFGTLYSLSGATLGATFSFLIARYLAHDWVEKKANQFTQKLIKGVSDEGWRFVALTRLVPLFPFNLLNYALGLSNIGALPYVIASFIFMAPGAFAYSWLGFAGKSLARGDADTVKHGLIAVALIATVILIARLVKQFKR
jgi:uncharacterized membrane protein YdjX (TVP38/TMEM64 family)